jgi:two-component system, NtrC family, nitrogen regulation sensor histidine kinase NtrY
LSDRSSPSRAPRRRRLSTEQRLFVLVLSCGIPAAFVLGWLAFRSELPLSVKAAIAFVVLAWIYIVADRTRIEVLRHIRTLSNLIESTRAQDYSMKGSGARDPGELAELYQQINGLTESLKIGRQSEQELLSILEKVVGQINVAIIVFDSRDKIRLVNQLATKLLQSSAEELTGVSCADTVIGQLPVSTEPVLIDFRFPGAEGRWQIRQHYYRHEGQESRIVFIADLKQVLFDEEIAAWQRLIRVISHEVNNSLTPITSLCQTLDGLLAKSNHAGDADVRVGLSVIAERAKGLQDFISVYARLARLPEPHRVPFPAATLASKLQRIFAGRPLEIVPFPDVTVFGDPVHLEQALINLIKNGLEANPPDAAPVQLSCRAENGEVEFLIADRGSGIGNPDNLFVPFYTTKREGAGIGLILCRQIAAKHHGHVSLENRDDGPGAVARLSLPLPVA